ncbi:trypsin epsilon-like [Phymastichus coffea]|uniref:trypsin epsilon-like n=1 Tax=Phymastichus coffea TaxID=108790 RepID=UPI00273B8C0E|nr:trypsin epsilon-like [Phymastichus coffea]
MAALKYNDHFACAGTIISSNKILTAANCFWCRNQPLEECVKNFTVQTGSADLSIDGNLHRVKEIKIFDGYTGKFANDIAVVTLQSEIMFSANEKAASLPDTDITENTVAISSGWGIKTEDSKIDNKLASIEEKILSASKCNEFFLKNGPNIDVDDNDFCAIAASGNNNTGLCVGDTGNPSVVGGTVIGVATYGVGCGKGFPDVFTNVYRFLKFIKSQL